MLDYWYNDFDHFSVSRVLFKLKKHINLSLLTFYQKDNLGKTIHFKEEDVYICCKILLKVLPDLKNVFDICFANTRYNNLSWVSTNDSILDKQKKKIKFILKNTRKTKFVNERQVLRLKLGSDCLNTYFEMPNRVLRSMIKNGVKVDERDEAGETVLMRECRLNRITKDRLPILKTIVEKGVNFRSKNSNGDELHKIILEKYKELHWNKDQLTQNLNNERRWFNFIIALVNKNSK